MDVRNFNVCHGKGTKMDTIKSTILIIIISLLAGCGISEPKPAQQESLKDDVAIAIAAFKEKDPGIKRFFSSSYGYAVLPKIFKGAVLVGGAYGKGEVFEQGKMIGYCNVTQGSLGASLGGEYYREIIFFKDKQDLDLLTSGAEYTFAAQMSALAIHSGVASKADYKAGMIVFITTDTGLMVDASLGGQKLRYLPKTEKPEPKGSSW